MDKEQPQAPIVLASWAVMFAGDLSACATRCHASECGLE